MHNQAVTRQSFQCNDKSQYKINGWIFLKGKRGDSL